MTINSDGLETIEVYRGKFASLDLDWHVDSYNTITRTYMCSRRAPKPELLVIENWRL